MINKQTADLYAFIIILPAGRSLVSAAFAIYMTVKLIVVCSKPASKCIGIILTQFASHFYEFRFHLIRFGDYMTRKILRRRRRRREGIIKYT